MKHSTLFAGLSIAGMLLASTSALALEVPVNDGFVTDAAGLLSTEEQEALEQDLSTYRTQTSNEIAVVILQSLEGEVAADVATEIGRKWGVGTEKDNGILLLVSYEDREIWIATGYGLEGAIPDLVAHGIAERDIAPAFREGEYAQGIQNGIDALKKHIGGEYTAERYAQEPESGGMIAWIFFIVFIGFNWLAALFARTKSWWLGGVCGGVCGIILTILYSWWLSIPVLVLLGMLFDYIVSKHGINRRGRGGWGSGGGWGGGRSGGGGGFGGFGGGSYGGGGGGSKW